MLPVTADDGSVAALNMGKCVDNSWANGSHPEYRGVSVRGEQLFVPKPKGMGDPGRALSSLANDMGITSWAYDSWCRYFGALREFGITEVCGFSALAYHRKVYTP